MIIKNDGQPPSAISAVKDRFDMLEARLKAVEDDLGLKPTESEPVVDKSWPQEGDDYWALNTTGDITNYTWGGYGYNLCDLHRGRACRTKEEAEKADLLDVAMHELKVMSEKDWSGYSPPKAIPDRLRCHCTFNFEGSFWHSTTSFGIVVPGVVYFPCEHAALSAYEAIDAKYPGTIR